MKPLTCPRCGRGTLAWEPWGRDVVAVCRFVRVCGLRVTVPGGAGLGEAERRAYVERAWREEPWPRSRRWSG